MINLYIVEYYSLFKTNGVTTYLQQLTNHAVASDLVSLNFIWINSEKRKGFTKGREDSTTHYYVPGNIDSISSFSDFELKVVSFLRFEIGDKNNIIFHFNWINHCPFAYLLKQYVNCKTLLTQHCTPWRELVVQNYPSYKRNNSIYFSELKAPILLSPILRRELWSYLAMDHIICVSNTGKQSLQKMLGYSCEKISVIYNGIALPKLKRTRTKIQALRKKHGIDPAEKIILYAGSIQKKKGVYDLVKAFNALVNRFPSKPLRLVVCGQGDFVELLRTVTNNRIKMTITGHLDKRELNELILLSDVGVVPSYVEPFGYSAIEMMGLGLPIIVSDVDGLKEIVPNSFGLKLNLRLGKVCADLNMEEIIEKIMIYLDNDSLGRRYGRLARAHVREHFTSKRMWHETFSVYKSLCDKYVSHAIEKVHVSEFPKISVVIFVDSSHSNLEECVASVVAQTYKKIELFIISSSNTEVISQLQEKYPDLPIHSSINEKFVERVNSLNEAVKVIDGEYVAFINGSDIMHSKRLEMQVSFLEQEENRSVAILGTNHFIIGPQGNVAGVKQYPSEDVDIKICMLFHPAFQSSTIMMRSSVIKEHGYSIDFPLVEEYEMWFRLAKKFEYRNLPDFLTSCRISEKKISQQENTTKKENTMELLTYQFDELGLYFTQRELTIHMAMVFGYGKRFFKNSEKLEDLNEWISKVLRSSVKKYNISKEYSRILHTSIVEYQGL